MLGSFQSESSKLSSHNIWLNLNKKIEKDLTWSVTFSGTDGTLSATRGCAFCWRKEIICQKKSFTKFRLPTFQKVLTTHFCCEIVHHVIYMRGLERVCVYRQRKVLSNLKPHLLTWIGQSFIFPFFRHTWNVHSLIWAYWKLKNLLDKEDPKLEWRKSQENTIEEHLYS